MVIMPSRRNNSSQLPWSEKSDTFFRPIDIDPDRWDRIYPFRLLVVEAHNNGSYSIVYGGRDIELKTYMTPDYVLQESVNPGGWVCNLPITPQQLQIIDHFAINTSATMRGIIEEHNGVKFKTIAVSGTTGIWPLRPTIAGGLPDSNRGSIFAGTLEAAGGVADSARSVARAFTGKHPSSVPKYDRPSRDTFTTGYYQALRMQQFFEQYALAKKDPANKNWRLAFDMPKYNQTVLVSPQQFVLHQNQQKPNEMLFNFQLKAWKRIDLKRKPSKLITYKPLDSEYFQRAVNTLKTMRRTLSNSINLVKSVRSDWRNILNVGRQSVLALKDVGGLVLAISDLPEQLIQDFNSLIIDEVRSIPNSFRATSNIAKGGNLNTSSTIASAINPSSVDSDEKTGSIINSIVLNNQKNEGLSGAAVANGALGQEAIYSQRTDPINNVFEEPYEYFDFFDTVELDALPLNNNQLEAIDRELDEIRLLTIDDFRQIRTTLYGLYLDISNSYGTGDETFSEFYNRPDPRERALPITLEENEVLLAIMNGVQELDYITSTTAWDDSKIENPLEYVGVLARDAGIDFIMPNGKVLVPVPFGLTVEEIAARYLGDPDRWLEIVNLNNLRSPYIDEDGFRYSLLSNAEGRNFNVDDTDSSLYVGQQVVLGSSSVTQFTRYITEVTKIGDGNFLITVDGTANLDNLTLSDNAYIQGYLPGTVNSQNQLYIPTDLNPSDEPQTFEISGMSNQHLTQISKIDWLLTDSGDLAINSVGDFRLANGLNNLVQAMKLKIRTRRGTLLRHLDYGLGIKHGISIAEIERGELFKDLSNMVTSDPRFDFISRLEIKLNKATLAIDMDIGLANGNGVLPLNFDIRI